MLRNTVLPTLRRIFVPSFGGLMFLVAWGCWWAFMMVGAAILMANDNPRRESEGTPVGQPVLSYLDALYFLEVATTSCGLGDIVPVTNGGRAIIFIWSFIGTGLWGVIIGGIVIKLTNWIFVDILMASYWEIRKRKAAIKRRDTQLKEIAREEEHEEEEQGQKKQQDLEKQQQKEERKEEEYKQPLEAKVLPWYGLFLLNGLGVIFWFTAHLTFAAVLHGTGPLGNLGDLTPDSYGNIFYFSLVASQTICFGTDYNPKVSEGRAFWLFWHQVCMFANTFLFTVVTLALLKWLDEKSFWIVGKLLHKARRKRVDSDTENEDSESDDTKSE